jgi:hypothetical protein
VVRREKNALDDFKKVNAKQDRGANRAKGNTTSQMESSFCRHEKVKWDIVVDTTNEQLGMGFIVWDHEGFVLVA